MFCGIYYYFNSYYCFEIVIMISLSIRQYFFSCVTAVVSKKNDKIISLASVKPCANGHNIVG